MGKALMSTPTPSMETSAVPRFTAELVPTRRGESGEGFQEHTDVLAHRVDGLFDVVEMRQDPAQHRA
jgi:hypothetical protein